MIELNPVRDEAYGPSREDFMLAYTKVLHTELSSHSTIALCEADIDAVKYCNQN